jgi:hypothetical protein
MITALVLRSTISLYRTLPNTLTDCFDPPPVWPCGKNANASRTWVDILDPNGRHIYGFCALKAASELQNLWFAVRRGIKPPSSIRVVLTDRAGGAKAEGTLDIPKK